MHTLQMSRDLSWIDASPRFLPFRLDWAATPGCAPPLTTRPTVATVIGPPFLPASASDVVFNDPSAFRSGSIHERAQYWDGVLDTSRPLGARAQRWIREGVDIFEFFRPYRGPFHGAPGRYFDSAVPPPLVLPNHPSCRPFSTFIAGKLAEMVASGAVEILGRVGEVPPPHLCLPIGIEPLKPRMIHDAQFLNLWCFSDAFGYDGLHMLPTTLGQGHFAWTLDHVSGYLHVKLTPRSRAFFGIQFDGIYYAWTVLSFGWIGSCLVYNTLSTEVGDYLHRLGVPNLVYLDDNAGGELVSASPALTTSPGRLFISGPTGARPSPIIALSPGRGPGGRWPGGSGIRAARAAVFVASSVWTALGYFLQVHIKSILEPQRSVQWLGVVVDTGGPGGFPSFRILPSKRASLGAQVEACLEAGSVAHRDLERLTGRCASLFLVIPGCLHLLRCMYEALATSRGRGYALIPLPPGSPLHDELALWRWVPDSPPRPWLRPTHATLEIWDVIYKSVAQAGMSDAAIYDTEPHELALHYRVVHPELPPDSSGGWINISFDWDYSPLLCLFRNGVPSYSTAFIYFTIKLTLQAMPSVVSGCFLDICLSASFRPLTIFGRDLCHDPDFALWLFRFAAERNLIISTHAAPGRPYAFEVAGRRRNPTGVCMPSPALPASTALDRMLNPRAFRAIAAAFEAWGVPRFRVDLMGAPSFAHSFGDGVALPSLTRYGLYRYGRPALSLRPGGSLGSQCLARLCKGPSLFVDPHVTLVGPLLAHLRLQQAGPVVVILPCDSRAYWFPSVAALGLAAMVVCPAGTPLPYTLRGYGPQAPIGYDQTSGTPCAFHGSDRGGPQGQPAAGPGVPHLNSTRTVTPPTPLPAAAATIDSSTLHSESAMTDSGDPPDRTRSRRGPHRHRPGQGLADWVPISLPLPAPVRLPHDLLAVLFDFRAPGPLISGPPRAVARAEGRGPLASVPSLPPTRPTRDFTYVSPFFGPRYV